MAKTADKEKSQTRKKQINAIHWEYLAAGSYNRVYDSKTPYSLVADDDEDATDHELRWVQRKPYRSNPLSSTDRVIRLFHEIEPDVPVYRDKKSVILPFFGKEIGGGEATQVEKAQKVIDVFKATGRIILDASVPGNFYHLDGKVMLTDPDMAVRPDSPTSVKGFFKSEPELKKYKKLSWYEAIRHYQLFPTSEHYLVGDVMKVVLGVIDLAEYFGIGKVPDKFLKIDFMLKLFDARKAKKPMSSILHEQEEEGSVQTFAAIV